MDSYFASNRLSDYIDGQLSAEEAAEVRAALEADPKLRAQHAAMIHAVEMLRAHGPTQAPPSLHANIMAEVGQTAQGGVLIQLRHRLSALPIEAVALAAAAVIVVTVLLNPSEDTNNGAPPIVDVRGGSMAPLADIEPAEELQLPLALATATPDVAPPPEPPPTATSAAPAVASTPAIQPPAEPYVADWEQEAPLGATANVPVEDADASEVAEGAAGDPKEAALDAPEVDPALIPLELTEGVPITTATPYAYRITLSNADVLYSLEELAQRTGGVLLDPVGAAMVPRALTDEQNYQRVQLVVPSAQTQLVHDQLRVLGGRQLPSIQPGSRTDAPNAAFTIEVTFNP